jgi:NNP family nitrate/nitrite transporter-like MFS transporter
MTDDDTTAAAAATAARDAQAGRQLALATIAFTVCFFAWSLLGPLAPDLQDDLGLSDFESSAMVAVPVLLGSVMRIPLGWLTDRLGGRPIFIALMGFTLLPLLALIIWHDSLGALLLFGFLLGFAGASFAVGVPMVNGWYPPARQGFALGVYGMGMGGTTLAGLIAPRMGSVTAPFWVAIGALLVTMAVFVAFARDAPRPPRTGPAPGMFAALGIFKTSGRAWALTLFYFLAFGGFVAMFLYLPKLLTGVHHLSQSDAGARAAGFALLAVIGRPTGGWLSDRIGAATVLHVCFVGTAVLATVLAFTYKHIVPLTVACLALAAVLGLGSGAVFKLVPDWFPDRVGAITGVVGAAGGLGGFFPPLVMGVVKSATGNFIIGFLLMALVAVVCEVVLRAVTARADDP